MVRSNRWNWGDQFQLSISETIVRLKRYKFSFHNLQKSTWCTTKNTKLENSPEFILLILNCNNNLAVINLSVLLSYKKVFPKNDNLCIWTKLNIGVFCVIPFGLPKVLRESAFIVNICIISYISYIDWKQ